ncbi:hypothetical protein N0V88_006227 [Collariella sp. IMI 366227]|nr:hypothetical protein N0V88_006227 [Collariella sp. IMI 366227]
MATAVTAKTRAPIARLADASFDLLGSFEFSDIAINEDKSDETKPSDAVEAGHQDWTSEDDSDDDSVVFMGEQSVTAEAYTAPSFETGDEHEATGVMNENTIERLKASLHAVDDMELWEATYASAPHQMEAAYEFLRRSFGGLDGGIMALDTGLGKTMASLAAVAVMRLVELNYSEVRRDQRITGLPHRPHNQPGVVGPCPSHNPWGIECCCVSSSLAQKIARGLTPGPSLVITPPNVVTQFAQAAIKYLEKEIQVPGSNAQMSFVDTLELSADTIARGIYQPPKKDKQPTLFPGSLSKMGYGPDQTSRLFRKHWLLVLSSSPQALSPRGGVYRFFSRRYELRQQQRERLKEYFAPWAVAPRFIALDEFHSAKAPSTLVHRALRQIQDQAAPGHNFKLAGLSATPIAVSLAKSLGSVLSLIVPSAPDLNAFCAAAQIIDSATKAGRPKDKERFDEAIATLFHGQALVPLPKFHATTVACRSKRAEEGDFQRRMGELTAAWGKEARAKLQKQQAASGGCMTPDKLLQSAQFNSSFMQLLWLASFPGIVDLPENLSSDLADWLNSSKIDSSVATSEGRAAHIVGQHINTITKGSGKIEQLSRCLYDASCDLGLGNTAAFLKKHACVLASRPGLALIIAAYADRHWSHDWDIVLMLSGAIKKGKRVIRSAFPDIPIRDERKPTLLIATTGSCGTGVDGLQRANHGVLFDMPFVESVRKQTPGRLWRYGQRYPCYWTELWAEDSLAERLIKERHERRLDAFNQIFGRGDSDSSAGGSASKE